MATLTEERRKEMEEEMSRFELEIAFPVAGPPLDAPEPMGLDKTSEPAPQELVHRVASPVIQTTRESSPPGTSTSTPSGPAQFAFAALAPPPPPPPPSSESSLISGPPSVSGPPPISSLPPITGPPLMSGALPIAGPPPISGPPTISGPSTISGQPPISGPPPISGLAPISVLPPPPPPPPISGLTPTAGPVAAAGPPQIAGPPPASVASTNTGPIATTGPPSASEPPMASGQPPTSGPPQSSVPSPTSGPPLASGPRAQFIPHPLQKDESRHMILPRASIRPFMGARGPPHLAPPPPPPPPLHPMMPPHVAHMMPPGPPMPPAPPLAMHGPMGMGPPNPGFMGPPMFPPAFGPAIGPPPPPVFAGPVGMPAGPPMMGPPVVCSPPAIMTAPAVYAAPPMKTAMEIHKESIHLSAGDQSIDNNASLPSLISANHKQDTFQIDRITEECGVISNPLSQIVTASVTEDFTTGRKKEKKKKIIRLAGGTAWEDNSLCEWDTDDFRIFCGDLGNDVTDEVLTRAFSRFPSFVKAKVIRDKRNNKTKGYGFVSFKDPGDFIKAMREMNGKYVGSRPIKLRKSTWRDRNIEVVRKKQKEKERLGLL